MAAFSFVHCADLHLDSPFVGLSQVDGKHPRLIESLRDATFRAFDAVIQLCLAQKVDFLLVAGDVYDGAHRSLRAQLKFRDNLKRLSDAGIRSFIIHGNHDPLDGWAASIQMPERVHVFGPKVETVCVEKKGEAVAHVHGVSFPTRSIGKSFGHGFRRADAKTFQIGLFHCSVGSDLHHENYAPRTIDELAAAGLDYWALGHIHQRGVLRESHPCIAYSGNTQGRHTDESGARGCYLVRVADGGELEEPPQFVATDVIRWASAEIGIAGIGSEEELLRALEAKLEELLAAADGRHVIARLTLSGRGPLHRSLSRANASQEFAQQLREYGLDTEPFIWVEQLNMATRPEIDLAARRQAQDFLGDLLRLIDEIRRSPERLPQLRPALAPLYEHVRAGRVLKEKSAEDAPPELELRALLDDAESRCIDLLTAEDA